MIGSFRILLIVSLAILSVPSVFADGNDADKVSVHVRTVMATEPKMASTGQSPIIDSRLQDLALKFQKLQFRTFKLVSSQTRVVGLERKEVMSIGSGNTLMLRPISMDKNRVGMWIKWTDSAGVEVLDTRMHFECGDSMITGADHTGDSGIILAIDVEPVK